ncbi:hypothetical protein HYT84_03600 [Candidatus Micrarchaeota archaeon]|nr:hypothetical protein [Candidatus Micrarchaeota archaeon]
MGFFDSFVKRVMAAGKTGKLGRNDLSMLNNLFTKTNLRNKVLARGILSALKAGNAKDSEIKRLTKLLGKATERINDNRKPFSPSDEKELRLIFESAGLSIKTTRWFTLHMDQFLNNEINEELIGKGQLVPSKKVVKFETGKQKLRG